MILLKRRMCSFPSWMSDTLVVLPELFHGLAEVLLGKGINHGVLVLASPMSSPSVVLDYPFNPATRLIMQSWVCQCLFASVAR
jgi:hypothetical protein